MTITREQFFRLVEEAVEATPGTVKGDESLDEVNWDSLSSVTFMALVDERLGTAVEPQELARCRSVADLVKLMGDALGG